MHEPNTSPNSEGDESSRDPTPDLEGLWRYIQTRETSSRLDRGWLEKMLEFAPSKAVRSTTCREYLLELHERIRKAGRHHVRIGLTDDDYDRKTHRAMSVVLTYSVIEKLDFRVNPQMKFYFDWLKALRQFVCHALEFEVLDGPDYPNSDTGDRAEEGVIPLARSDGPIRRLPLTHAGVRHGWLEFAWIPPPFNPIWFHVFQPIWLEVESKVRAAIETLGHCGHCRSNGRRPSWDFKLQDCPTFGNCREWNGFKYPCDINLLEERRVYKSNIECPSRCGKDRARRQCKIS